MAPSGSQQTEVAEPSVDIATDEVVDLQVPWVVIVWNDPINLMSYVSFVLQKLFGYPKEKADVLMMDVHEKGRAVVSNGPREKAEIDVFRLHEHGLWATMQQDT
ncbi:MAG: ATP-dependent Clp protease adapter ClpS [Actinobacteria bacterium]|nr:ATP-dependent Clp protease adapter ClpS [Actinomycetota bacterium]MSZ60327.1 ATP-dependent Clp protease adapter ClpS [Actinomycetota bacterium]MSZ81392.1 ATP-dependent Clp protease adapter ClpS [Actinomycetota bacterium]MTB12246.1 ATP-dependent Clp protease adapter ClpS [Actinomycetota bacterium]